MLEYLFISDFQGDVGPQGIPGPPGLPLVGNIFSITPEFIHVAIDDWAKKYGDIYKINFFGDEVGKTILVFCTIKGNYQESVLKNKYYHTFLI